MKKRIISLLLTGTMLLSTVGASCQSNTAAAAARIRVSKTKVTVVKGANVTIQAKNTGSKRIKAKIADRRIISVKITKKKIRITGKKRGQTKLTLTASRMKKCVVKVQVKPTGSKHTDTAAPANTRQPLLELPIKASETPMVKYTRHPSVTATARATARATASAKPQSSLRPTQTRKPVPSPTVGGEKVTQKPDIVKPPVQKTMPPYVPRTIQPLVTAEATVSPTAPPTAPPYEENIPTTEPPTEPPAVSTPEAPVTEPPVESFSTTRLCIGDRSIYIGESVNALVSAWGDPERIDSLPQNNIAGYIYNSFRDTEPYVMVGIRNEKVVFYFTIAKDFLAYDATIDPGDSSVLQQTELVQEGTSAADMVRAGWDEAGTYEFDALDSSQGEGRVGTEAYYRMTDSAHVYAFTDYFDENDRSIYGIYAFSRKDCTFYEMMYRSQMSYNDDILRALEKQIWEITNAYRKYMGLSMLLWDDKAAEAAGKHSRDMAENSYFNHYSLNGNSPGTRMNQEGISWRKYAENICAGSADAIGMTIGWIGSSGHRKNILNDVEYLGVGIGYNSSDSLKYNIYATQDFWR